MFSSVSPHTEQSGGHIAQEFPKEIQPAALCTQSKAAAQLREAASSRCSATRCIALDHAFSSKQPRPHKMRTLPP